ncbi:MAG: hypothetical protein CM15mV49_050 [uncultured marine virus]|nr:MAG: hypothetical protein CM15mV49_050 [uncultured marine virus]
MGRIQSIDLPVDNSWEGKVAIFPAGLKSCGISTFLHQMM